MFVRIDDRSCLELELARHPGPGLGALADALLLTPAGILADVGRFRRNQPILEALNDSLGQALLDAWPEQELRSLRATRPHLGGEPSPFRVAASSAELPYACCRLTPHGCLDFPLAVSRETRQLYPAWDPNPGRWPQAREGEERRLEDASALEAYLKDRAAQRVQALAPRERLDAYLELRLDPSTLTLPADGTLYVQLPGNHLLFDPLRGPVQGVFGSVT